MRRIRARRLIGLSVAALAVFSFSPAAPASAGTIDHPWPDSSHHGHAQVVRVGGAVATPAAYTREELAALPQVGLTDQRDGRHTLSGVLLQTVIQASNPVLPTAKNPQLRVVADVSGRADGRGHDRSGRISIALGELDPGFGNHPALLVLQRDGHDLRSGPELAFPSDTNHRRDLARVMSIDIHLADATMPDDAAGSLLISDGRRSTVLSDDRLRSLPQRTVPVSFLASGSPQSHVEQGPSLATVLHAARIPVDPDTSVTAVGSDGYAAAVTPAEQTSGGRPLLISLSEDNSVLTRPRLIPAGDVKGGRYVSDLVSLVVQQGSRPCARH